MGACASVPQLPPDGVAGGSRPRTGVWAAAAERAQHLSALGALGGRGGDSVASPPASRAGSGTSTHRSAAAAQALDILGQASRAAAPASGTSSAPSGQGALCVAEDCSSAAAAPCATVARLAARGADARPPAFPSPQVNELQQRLALASPGSPLLALPEAAETLSEALGVDLVA
jgi:hypothetical protein